MSTAAVDGPPALALAAEPPLSPAHGDADSLAAVKQLLLGGADVGQNALIRFYTLHIAVLPLIMIIGVSLHLWRVRKDGGLAANDAKEEKA